MIMPIALAKDGFIDFTTNAETTLQGFLDNLNFENKDLQFFDGNTCRLINDYDPTNSVFIYTNQQGRFLYTITSATPLIHKNNLIWLCNCYQMENLTEYEKLDTLPQKKLDQLIFTKGIFNENENPLKITIKDNFEAIQKYKIPITTSDSAYNYFTLKIKCTTNPTTENLQSEAPDGSFNFLFPLRIEEQETETGFKIEKFTTKISNSDGTIIVSLYDIVSKYLPNIKSIELLPFNVNKIGSETLVYDVLPVADAVSLSPTGDGTFTDCGIFIKTNYSFEYNTLDIDYSKLPSFDAKNLIVGGGIKGFLQTPIGNIELLFNSELFDDLPTGSYLIKENGWKIDGKFKCDIPPLFLDFYTDNAGQLFIQNLTTNAQELRQINRDKIFKEETNQQNFINSSLKSATGFISNLATGNVANAFGNIGNIANSFVESEFNKISIEREYNKSLAEFRDKEKTQSLLASMTGRELNGQFSLIDFLEKVNNKYFCLYFETNFTNRSPFQIESGFKCQPNYDYSIDVEELSYNITDQNYLTFNNNINYLASFRRYVVDREYNVITSRKINLFLRVAKNRLQ